MSTDPNVSVTAGLAKILHKLSVDDGFRAAFTQDPQGILHQHGIELSPDQVPGQVQLPSKDDLRDHFDHHLDEKLTQVSNMAFMAMAFGGQAPPPGHKPHKP